MTGYESFAREVSQGALGLLATGPAALGELPALCRRLAGDGERVILTDDVAKLADGRDLLAWVADLVGAARRVTVRATHAQVALDEATVEDAVAEVGRPSLLVSVGSGTITDLGKVVSARSGAPLVAIQTAASVNGFSDPLSVLVIGGAKRTRPSVWPTGLIIDDRVIDAAPARLNRSGVGDAIAIWSAPADWYLACSLGLDGPFTDEAVRPVLDAVEGLTDPDPGRARKALVDSLTVGGLVIGVADSTAPLSGSEHLTSHILDMAAMARGVEHDLHGAQVGVATVVCTALWAEVRETSALFERPWADLTYPADLEQRVRDTWASIDPSGSLGQECWTAVARKVAAWNAADKAVCDRDRAALLETLFGYLGTPQRSATTLRHWGAAARFSELTPPVSADQVAWTLLALPYMRDRLTLPDLLVMTGEWTAELIDRVLARAATAGGGV
ncbi:iron-containing alcohol dehydrogenase [Micropruina sonneratiae]|uniref:iron-containing alcohol dehydrogenase n=1 Tax=Micropruina sonneratiae TaxID=2986940 RepID=UPI00222714FD|nr:iron-containing alcohol dehydrogenase [Micropruina sp. KQZ13P-5]MCW3159342.1 iron-containing alcohol dehydrogenase [Micropruina sp. KQZ13P-5]